MQRQDIERIITMRINSPAYAVCMRLCISERKETRAREREREKERERERERGDTTGEQARKTREGTLTS